MLSDILGEFARGTREMALATIVSTTGSSYRKPGARMLVLHDGRTVGSLSGGCIEQEVAQRAIPVMASGDAALFSIDTLRRFGCHGTIRIFLERIEPANEFMRYLMRCSAEREPARVVVVLDSAIQTGSFPRNRAPADTEGFEETIAPPIRVIIIGNSPGTSALLGFARILGWNAMVWEQPLAAEIHADARTAVIIKNHHFGRDCAALRWALPEPFGYVGLLGSHKRKRALLDALFADESMPPIAALRPFHSPAGLDVGAASPEEIALSITAEIQAVMSRHEGGFLRDRHAPVHKVLCSVAAP